MEHLKEILQVHAQRYPRMEPTDAVKLLYQNEFGGGHLIADEAACRAYLEREWEATPRDETKALAEPIGNGLVRVQLAAVQDREWLFEAFVSSAREHTGKLEDFLEKLRLLRSLTEQGRLPFELEKLDGYLRDYRAAGYPMVSHSAAYRQAYKPAYRVILETKMNGGKQP